ncbi:pneumococcal-type histidine triad protein [Streptococcus ruminantium]|uniref:pneumococcal-type histidine triad protein n=1 Tax=Streptococcus ruminantium TaxID=1917441 RepID=UPI0012DDB6A0|nr:pneumococcal-type histidine triad protein [Streptococcus ruminantium]
MKKRKLLYSSLILATLAGTSGIAYQLGIANGRREVKSSVDYVSQKVTKKGASSSKTSPKNPEEDAKDEGISAEQIVVKITAEGYVTSHGDHFHYYNGKVPFDAIFSEELLIKDPTYKLDESHIISTIKDGYIIKVNGQYYIYLKQNSKQNHIRSKEEIDHQRQQTSNHPVDKSSPDGSYTTDDGYIFKPSDIIEDLGNAFVVRHKDHLHYIPKSDLSENERTTAQSYWNQRRQQVHTSKSTIPSQQTDNYSRTSPVNVNNSIEAKRAYMAKMYGLAISDIQIAGDYFTYPHGNHRHALPISQVIVGQFPTAASVEADLNHRHTNIPIPLKPATKPIQTEPIAPQNNDKELQDKINYIAQLYGIDPERIQLQGDSLIWPHEDHTHGMAISEIVIPKISDDPEADFEAELTTLAKTLHVDPSSIIIQDGTMTVPHGDHSHTYKIKSPGWRDYIKHKIPALDGSYIAGPLDRKIVRTKVQELILSAKTIFQDDPKQLRRIKAALGDFENGLDWATNSTQGYLKILDDFDKKYIQLTTVPVTIVETAEADTSWADVDALVQKIQDALPKAHEQYSKALSKLQSLKESIGYRQETPATLKVHLLQFAAEHQLNLEQAIAPSVTVNDSSNFETAKEQVHAAILRLNEDKYLLKRVQLLNKVYDAKTISELQAIQDELSHIGTTASNPALKQVDDLKQYLKANENDNRLTSELKTAIQDALKNDSTSVQSLTDLKQKIKDSYRQADIKQHQLVSRITELLSQIQEAITALSEGDTRTRLEAESEELKNLLQITTSDKDALLLRAQELKAKIEKSTDSSEIPEKESSSEDSTIATETPVPVANPELVAQIEAIIDFITDNRRKIETTPITLKVELLNKADDLEAQFKARSKNLQELYEQLQSLKTQIEPHIKADNSTNNTAANDWGSGW